MNAHATNRVTIVCPQETIEAMCQAAALDVPQACWADLSGHRYAAMSFPAGADFALPPELSSGIVTYGASDTLMLVPGRIHVVRTWDGAKAIETLGLRPILPDC